VNYLAVLVGGGVGAGVRAGRGAQL